MMTKRKNTGLDFVVDKLTNSIENIVAGDSAGGVSEGRGDYEDIPGFCASAPISKVKELDYVLTPGRYVGLPDDEDDFDFKERFNSLKAELEEQLKEEAQLNELIVQNLSKINL
ncbi:MAG: hypothetical protein Q8S18_08900 [Bacteroidales bacterium]|nr:hypothetical protein [Bacteroidales bacterium]